MKKLIVKLLFRLLGFPFKLEKIDENRRYNWLISIHGNGKFIDYFKKRDLSILKSLGMIQEKENQWMLIGQRLELLYLADQAKRAFESEEKIKKVVKK
jgi:hypothetical protein